MSQTDFDTYKLYEHQVAGSHSEFNSQLLRGKYGRVLKPYKLTPNSTLSALPRTLHGGNKDTEHSQKTLSVNPEPACENEKGFYELCYERQDLGALKELIPRYFGEVTVILEDKPTPHLLLEDLTEGCLHPCVADVKVGPSFQYVGCAPERLIKDAKKYPSRHKLGWCVTGLKQFTPEGEFCTKFGPKTSQGFTIEETLQYTKSFVTASGHRESSILLEQIIARIESILAWFLEQKMFFFRGSSILVSYNAEYFQQQKGANPPQDSVSSEGNAANSGGGNKDPSKGQDEQLQVTNPSSDSEIGAGSDQEKASPLRVRVKMIDFAHVLKSGGHKDELYLVGLENFLAFLKECRQVVGT